MLKTSDLSQGRKGNESQRPQAPVHILTVGYNQRLVLALSRNEPCTTSRGSHDQKRVSLQLYPHYTALLKLCEMLEN